MKKRIFTVLLILVFMTVIFAGCRGEDPAKKYVKALDNSSGIQRASSRTSFEFIMDLQQSKIRPADARAFEMYSNIRGYMTTKYDMEKSILFLDGHVDLKNLGFDFKIFDTGEKLIILLPMFSRYMIVDKKNFTGTQFVELSKVAGKLRESNRDMISSSIKKGDIVKIEDRLISTPEGEIKSAMYDLNIENERVRQMFLTNLDILLKNREMEESIKLLIREGSGGTPLTDEEVQKIYDILRNKFYEIIDRLEFEETAYRVSIDKDFYIRQKSFSYDFKYTLGGSEFIKGAADFKTMTWDIGKSPAGLPELSEGSSFTVKSIGENTPKFYIDFFKHILK